MRILIVEDEEYLAHTVAALLGQHGFTCECVHNGSDALSYAATQSYDLLILDVMLPSTDGYAVARHLRTIRCSTPILMLTARSTLEDRIDGLNAGADYYMTKPFDNRELLACVRALLRRQGSEINELSVGETVLDLATCELRYGQRSVQLSAREFDVMRILLSAHGSIVAKETILNRVWGADSDAVENHVEAYVSFLRKKLRHIGSPLQIEARRRMGYLLFHP